MSETVTVTNRGAERIHAGHRWIYRTDLASAGASAGAVVAVVDSRRRRLGDALYSDRSQIALRMVTTGDQQASTGLWRARLEAAVRFRATLAIDATAYRLVNADADLLPSLIVDRYGDCLVLQALSQGTDRLLPQVIPTLVDLCAPRGILARNDPKVRLLEGLEQRVEVVHGEVPERVEVVEGGVRFEADLFKGQKTGLFLDQRENRDAAARYASGRMLDCFTYNGGFGLRAARTCEHVIAVDASAEACARVRANASLNGFTNVEVRDANVFDELRELERAGERFDTIVLDPPAFAKSRAALPKAINGYKEINLRALKLLRPGGYLVTCTCSYHVDEATFGEVVYAAAIDTGSTVTVVEKRMQGRDHPVMLGLPETYYLKCFVLRKRA
jgi:23S rRNA (cytosine1962-C5)-methyltransferase